MVQKAFIKNRAKKTNKQLHLIIPNNVRFPDIAADGLLIPGRLDDKEALAPLDFTAVNSREVGRQHSYWAVRHSHLIFLVGNLRAEVANLKHDLKNFEADWMVKHLGEFKNKWEADHAVGRDKRIKSLRGKLRTAEASLLRYEALAASYEGLRNAASREMSRRADERASRD